MSFEVTFKDETFEGLKAKVKEFYLALIRERKKLIPGQELHDTKLAEVQAALKQVEDSLGLSYVQKILDRIPVAGIADLRPGEYDRCIRLCMGFIDSDRLSRFGR